MPLVFVIIVKAVLPLVLALSICSGPALAWGGGDCPFSQKGANKEASTEKVENSESSN